MANKPDKQPSLPPPPPQWGKDELTGHLDTARQGHFATLANKPNAVARLKEIDACFCKITSNLYNPKPFLPAFFLTRCHSAWRTAAGLAMATQLPESFTMVRSSLEYAGYGLLIAETPGLDKVWLNRNDGDKSMTAMRKAFVQAKIYEAIAKHDRKLEKAFRDQYERSIDFGGHPNQRAVTSVMKIVDTKTERTFTQWHFAGNGLPLDHALRSVAQAGVGCLHIFFWIYEARFNLLMLRDRLIALRRGL